MKHFKFDKNFFYSQLLTAATILFYTLLFRHLGNIYSAIFVRPTSALDNLTEEKAEEIKMETETSLTQTSLNQNLYRYFVFFYLDDYTTRQVFLSGSEIPLSQPKVSINGDVFYTEMLTYHLNDVCYIRNTVNISESSVVRTNLSKTNEIQPNIFYVSCPIYVNDTLVGYIGGLNRKDDGSISIETSGVRNSSKTIQNILEDS